MNNVITRFINQYDNFINFIMILKQENKKHPDYNKESFINYFVPNDKNAVNMVYTAESNEVLFCGKDDWYTASFNVDLFNEMYMSYIAGSDDWKNIWNTWLTKYYSSIKERDKEQIQRREDQRLAYYMGLRFKFEPDFVPDIPVYQFLISFVKKYGRQDLQRMNQDIVRGVFDSKWTNHFV